MSKMSTTDVALGAFHTQKLQLKFTAVSAEIHSTWTHQEQTTQQYHNSLLWPHSAHNRHISFVFVLLTSLELSVVTQSRLVNSFSVWRTGTPRKKMFRRGLFPFSLCNILFAIILLSISSSTSIATFLGVNVNISDCWLVLTFSESASPEGAEVVKLQQ
jgi:hypothetical protein